MNISVIGLGKLGFPMANFLAGSKFKIKCYDNNKKIINLLLKKRRYLMFEAGLNKSKKNLLYFKKITEALMGTEICFITVPTPSNMDGSFSRIYILKVLDKVSNFIINKFKSNNPYLININSTINPGDINFYENYLKKKGLEKNINFAFIYNPYFVALGEVIKNLKNPNFILIGVENKFAKKKILQLYNQLYKTPIFKILNHNESELTKILLNSFVTMKISFTNFVSNICEKINIKDPSNILNALSSDLRIGTHYFKKGGPYAGPCFPRDNQALCNFCKKINVDFKIPKTSFETNNIVIKNYLDKLKKLKNLKTFGVLGVSYKSNTDCIDESISIKLMELAKKLGCSVIYYDPYTDLRNKKYLKVRSVSKVQEKSDLIFIGYRDNLFNKLSKFNKKIKIWDPVNLIKKKKNFTFI